jgi:hypothetical protein
MILHEGARLYLSHIVKDLDKERATERLGRYGVTLYSASEYISPLHFDKDDNDGYCWCEEWEGQRSTDDYGFVLAEFGIYFATESNCLWYVMTLLLLIC